MLCVHDASVCDHVAVLLQGNKRLGRWPELQQPTMLREVSEKPMASQPSALSGHDRNLDSSLVVGVSPGHTHEVRRSWSEGSQPVGDPAEKPVVGRVCRLLATREKEREREREGEERDREREREREREQREREREIERERERAERERRERERERERERREGERERERDRVARRGAVDLQE